jgi:hypothetical protein
MKSSNATIENRSRDLPIYSAVPQPLRHRMPPSKYGYVELIDFVYDWVHWLILKNTEMNIRVP